LLHISRHLLRSGSYGNICSSQTVTIIAVLFANKLMRFVGAFIASLALLALNVPPAAAKDCKPAGCCHMSSSVAKMPCCHKKTPAREKKHGADHSCPCVGRSSQAPSIPTWSSLQFVGDQIAILSPCVSAVAFAPVSVGYEIPFPCDLSPPSPASEFLGRAPPVL